MSCVVRWWDVLFVKGMHFSSKNARLLNLQEGRFFSKSVAYYIAIYKSSKFQGRLMPKENLPRAKTVFVHETVVLNNGVHQVLIGPSDNVIFAKQKLFCLAILQFNSINFLNAGVSCWIPAETWSLLWSVCNFYIHWINIQKYFSQRITQFISILLFKCSLHLTSVKKLSTYMTPTIS